MDNFDYEDTTVYLHSYTPPSGLLVPTGSLVNAERRRRTAERKALGMTGKQYRRHCKNNGNKGKNNEVIL